MGYSTGATIVDLTNNLLRSANSGLISLAAFINLRKAFDTVNHKILINKLACYGKWNSNLDWCSNYLSDRSQKILANGKLSDTESVS